MELKRRTVTGQQANEDKKERAKEGREVVDHGAEFETQIQMAREIMKKHYKGLNELAMK